jgi:hypothetical protein
MRRCTVPLALCLAILVMPTSALRAGKPKQVPFEEQVAKADFIGIVECETAGGIVAKYKVIESCRGAKPGEHIAIRVGINYWGQQFTIALCGQRFFCMAYRTAPNNFFSKSVGSAVPLWWRKLPADYEAPFGQEPTRSDINKYYEQAKALAAKLPAPAPTPAPKFDEVVWKGPDKQGPTKAQLDAWRELVAGKGGKKDVAEARDGLLMYDPAPLCQELVKWVPDEENVNIRLRRAENVWARASYFAWRCGQEREKNLKLLLTAKEPIVRVAGAVYLCFEDEKAGMKELAKLTELKDEAGAWAALTLARRGKNDAVPRVLDMFRGDQGIASSGNRESRMHAALRVHALVLFSNSAQKSGLPQPAVNGVKELARVEDIIADREVLLQWWLKNGARLTLHDPWLATLSKQKLD